MKIYVLFILPAVLGIRFKEDGSLLQYLRGVKFLMVFPHHFDAKYLRGEATFQKLLNRLYIFGIFYIFGLLNLH